MELIKDKYYKTIDHKDTFAIFKFNGEFVTDKGYTPWENPKYYYSLSNMNKHWEVGHHAFIRIDGVNTYPFAFNNSDDKSPVKDYFVSINRRHVVEATEAEIFWLDQCYKSKMFITKEELRNLILDNIL